MNSEDSNRSRSTDIELLKPYRFEAGYCYKVALDAGPWAQELAALGDSSEKPRQSPVILLENGQPIGRPHVSHGGIAEKGAGSFSHWNSTIYFSASDNTDPNENGRSYSLRIDRDFAREQHLATAVIEFLRARLAELGPSESGFYDYYSSFAQTGTPFQIYDKAVVRFVLNQARPYDRYVEIGAGIGQLGALLAAEGLRAVAVEGDVQRFKAAVALHLTLSQELDGFKDCMSVIKAFFPSEQVPIDRGTLVLCTNLIHSNNDEDALLAGFRDAGAVIIDICRFARSRTTTDGWRALIRRIRDVGFPYVDPVFSWGEPTLENQPSPSAGRLLYFHRGPQLGVGPVLA
jgi:hypothetical protein